MCSGLRTSCVDGLQRYILRQWIVSIDRSQEYCGVHQLLSTRASAPINGIMSWNATPRSPSTASPSMRIIEFLAPAICRDERGDTCDAHNPLFVQVQETGAGVLTPNSLAISVLRSFAVQPADWRRRTVLSMRRAGSALSNGRLITPKLTTYRTKQPIEKAI